MPEIGGDLAPNGAGHPALAAVKTAGENAGEATIVAPLLAAGQVGFGTVAAEPDPERSGQSEVACPPYPQHPGPILDGRGLSGSAVIGRSREAGVDVPWRRATGARSIRVNAGSQRGDWMVVAPVSSLKAADAGNRFLAEVSASSAGIPRLKT
jgi:hypothetical protein